MPNTALAREILKTWLDSNKNADPEEIVNLQRCIRKLEAYHEEKLPFQDVIINPNSSEPLKHQYTIWTTENAGSDESCKRLMENDPDYYETLTEEQILQMAVAANNDWRDDEVANLDGCEPKKFNLVAIRSMQTWQGHYTNLTLIQDVTLGKILSLNNPSYEPCYYGEDGEIFLNESHHDGCNQTLFRKLKNNQELAFMTLVEKLRDEHYHQPLHVIMTELKKELDAATESLWPDVAAVYGWPVA